jgi:hypothetical protein
MKISGTRGVDATQTRRTDRRVGAQGSFTVSQADAPRTAAPLSGATPLSAVDSLLALQAVPEASEGKRRAVKRAGDMLDLLDDIRLGLLEGGVPKGKLEGLLRMVQSRRDTLADAGLAQILDEIELRAQVELAKFGCNPLSR